MGENDKLLGEIHQMCENGEEQRKTIFKKLDEITADGCSTGKRLDTRVGRIEGLVVKAGVGAFGIVIAGHSAPKIVETVMEFLK